MKNKLFLSLLTKQEEYDHRLLISGAMGLCMHKLIYRSRRYGLLSKYSSYQSLDYWLLYRSYLRHRMHEKAQHGCILSKLKIFVHRKCIRRRSWLWFHDLVVKIVKVVKIQLHLGRRRILLPQMFRSYVLNIAVYNIGFHFL